jgi:protein tyrosine phosphatase (PTP) superfamily phosphohydrolase (DUF442 family)
MSFSILMGAPALAQLPDEPRNTTFAPLVSAHLPNAIRVHANLICGGLPADPQAFAELRKLGVQTLVSVDGAQPDVELARQFGLRYVHLPHGYDGIPEGRVRELAKAFRELPGPIYIHCHHGHHRSPAAAAVGSISAGLIDASEGLALLHQAGTSPNYVGLYRATVQARVIPPAATEQLQTVFVERAAVPPMATSMVNLEHTFDNLKQLASGQWRALPLHPDLQPRHEALLLREHFTELLRTAEVAEEPAGFRSLLLEGQRLSEQLELGLTDRSPGEPMEAERLSRIMQGLESNCRQCHSKFRDQPSHK